MNHFTSRTHTVCSHENKTYSISVEIHTRRGIPHTHILGNPSRGIKESIPRIRASIESCGLKFPLANITINLSPQDIPKNGNQYDLPIAAAVLQSMGELDRFLIDDNTLLLGELDLEGNLLPIQNLLHLFDSDFLKNKTIYLPRKNYKDGVYFFQNHIVYLDNLRDLIYPNNLNATKNCSSPILIQEPLKLTRQPVIMDSIYLYPEQVPIMEALEIALSGRHHMLITGTPGSGKTMMGELSQQLQSLPLPDEIIPILRNNPREKDSDYNLCRPFRNPHHSLTINSLVGGGNQLESGEITKAHKGILFLDELGEINSKILQSLREPIEKKEYILTRNNKHTVMESDLQFIGTSNLCPCGQLSNFDTRCICKKENIRAYLSKLTGPFMDRIPIILEFRVSPDSKMLDNSYSIKATRERINQTILLQADRNSTLSSQRIVYNSDITEGMWELLDWNGEDIRLWENFAHNNKLGKRQRDQTLGVSRTIADINRRVKVNESDLYSALSLREGSMSIQKMAA